MLIEEKVLWIVTTRDEFEYGEKIGEDVTQLARAYPSDLTAHEVALSFAQKYDANRGDYPMLYDGLELVVYAMRLQSYDPRQEFLLQADQFVVRGQLLPNYSVLRKLREEYTDAII